jgi:hypothetical protein
VAPVSEAFRIVFVPGLKPKPETALHRDGLLRCLLAGLARVEPRAAALVEANPEAFTVYPWTHAVYGAYRDFELDRPGIERLLAAPDASPADIAEIETIARKAARLTHVLGDAVPFLGRLFASERLRESLSEARRYLHDHDGMGAQTRAGLATILEDAAGRRETLIVIGHSLGSVIAYDTLWELSRDSQLRVELLLTLGSPLSTRFVQRLIKGAGASGAARYPHNIRRWVNCSARGELTALNPRVARAFSEMVRLGVLESLEDHVDIYNHYRGERGLNVHSAYGYLIHPSVAGAIASALIEQPAAHARSHGP